MLSPYDRVRVAQSPRVKPMMVWDGDCAFCGKWILRWKQATDDAVEYYPYQQVLSRFPEIGEERFSEAVAFIGLDGVAMRGAEAVFACLAFAGRYRFLHGLYQRYAWFASLMTSLYIVVAQKRGLFSKITRMFWGNSVEYASFRFSGTLFQRGMGLVYIIAFISFGSQMAGLAGSNGILPISENFSNIAAYFQEYASEASPAASFPSLLWYNSSDAALSAIVWVGALGGLFLLFGVLPGLSATVSWVCYLSLVNAVPVFLGYQWDMLLLEAGFLTIWMVPWVAYQRFSAPQEPNRIARWLIWWLLFRLMFESGVVKLLEYPNQINAWKDLTALNFHYFTQPLPNGLSRYFHFMPEWVHQLSIIIMLVIEIGVPFMLLFPRRIRAYAGIILIAFQLLLILSGNFGFFNILTIILCLSVFDDQSWPRPIQNWLKAAPGDSTFAGTLAPIGWIRIPLAAMYLLFGILQIGQSMNIVDFADYKQLQKEKWPVWTPLYQNLQRIHALNYYGLFRVMTTKRPEIVIEGSDDLHTWKPYIFKYKPGPTDRRPPFVTPHMPRLDWQLWFAALDAQHRGYPDWMRPFLAHLSNNTPEVTALLSENPFPHSPPKYLRLRLYDYTLTSPEDKSASGEYWNRTLIPERTLQLRTDQLQPRDIEKPALE